MLKWSWTVTEVWVMLPFSPWVRAASTSTAVVMAAAAVFAGVTPAVAAQTAAGAASERAISGTSSPEAVVRSRQVTRSTVSGIKTAVAPASTSFAFGSLLDGKPVRWDPCSPIRWTSNTSRGPAGGLAVLKAAVAQIAAQTGTTWTYAGASSFVPGQGYLPATKRTAYPPVLLGWTDGRSSDMLAGQPANVLGMARNAWFGVRRADGSSVAALRAGVVALDATDRLPLTGPLSWQAVVLHELSHVVGLGHTSDPRQLLAPVLPRHLAGLQAGDRAGLTRVGRVGGCVTVA